MAPRKSLNTTATVLRRLQVIAAEVAVIEDALRDATDITPPDRRRLNWEVMELRRRAEFLRTSLENLRAGD